MGEADVGGDVGEEVGDGVDADRFEHRLPLVGCQGNERHRVIYPR